jgi:hypothetical protein
MYDIINKYIYYNLYYIIFYNQYELVQIWFKFEPDLLEFQLLLALLVITLLIC